MKYIITLFITLLSLIALYAYFLMQPQINNPTKPQEPFSVRSIDTVKLSRDLALQKLNDPEFDQVIDNQVNLISQAGANYIAISTPYDDKFLPFLKKWVKAARKKHLKVWFRGNFAGWEGWFDYPKINKQEHLQKTSQFILNNPDLFEDGDIFTPCPECENGGPGDPRETKDVTGFRQFLIDEYNQTQIDFNTINKQVTSNYASMNYDVALLVMDEATTSKMGKVVTVDHYIKDPQKMIADVKKLAEKSKGKVVLGEYGVPIPDIHGNISEHEQAAWLDVALSHLSRSKEVLGVNYWTGAGSSSQLWDEMGNKRLAFNIIRKYYLK